MNKLLIVMQAIKWGVAGLFFIIALVVWGCSPKIEYKFVDVPVKCEISPPAKPKPVDNAVQMNLLILKYINELEATIRRCN